MASLKTEETLHHYLRRHFARISQSNALQVAEEIGATTKKGLVDTSSPVSSQVKHDEPSATVYR